MEPPGTEGCQLFLLSVGVGWGQGGERWEASQVLPGKTLPAHRLAGVRNRDARYSSRRATRGLGRPSLDGAQEEINQPPSIGRIEN